MSQASAVSPVVEVVEFFARGPSREEIASFRLSSAAQLRLRELLDRNAAGTLSEEEAAELDRMVLLDDLVSLIRVRAQGQGAPGASDPMRPARPEDQQDAGPSRSCA